MSAIETDRPPGLRCPHCQARLAPEQEWCLECGNPVRRRVSPASRRRSRVIAGTGALLAVAALAVALSLIALGQRGERRAQRPAATTRAPAAADRDAAADAPSAKTVPRANSAPETLPPPSTPATADTAPLWPDAEQGYTVIVLSSPRRTAAEKRARGLIAAGADAGILHADEYASFTPGQWIVWRGRYRDKAKAREAVNLLRRRIDGVYVTFVRPR